MDIKKYTQRPIECEAVLVKLEDYPNVASWCKGRVAEYFNRENNLVTCVEFTTSSGATEIVKAGDYLVKDELGFYCVKDDIFGYNFTEITT